ncbi:hypothetical protein [Thermodesulfatator atlanticus]|uniref:hypothetical protein n=1 Tax=Thermodesulfatator atlanticus TaxID=501497 RepID=UPI000A077525
MVTGSGSFEIKENLGQYLVGRATYLEQYPLNFAEFLLWKKQRTSYSLPGISKKPMGIY